MFLVLHKGVLWTEIFASCQKGQVNNHSRVAPSGGPRDSCGNWAAVWARKCMLMVSLLNCHVKWDMCSI